VTRLNYTQRKRITRDRVDLALDSEADPPQVRALINLDGLSLADDGEVVLEAYHQTRLHRIEAGPVADLGEVIATLKDFPDIGLIKFRLKVSAPSDELGRRALLAVADKLQPRCEGDEDAPRDPLLPFRGSADLGQEVWRVVFEADEPVVEMNSNLGDWRGFAQEPYFQTLVLPEVFRQVLIWLAEQPTEDDATHSVARWRAFLEGLGADVEPEEPDHVDTVRSWADEAVAKLARRHRWFEMLQETRGEVDK
jgi:hypothetical protein